MTALLPHCPGESQASLVISNVATIPKAEGLKMCFSRKRKIYLDAVVRKAAITLIHQWPVFKSRHRLAALMRILKPHSCQPCRPEKESNFRHLVLSGSVQMEVQYCYLGIGGCCPSRSPFEYFIKSRMFPVGNNIHQLQFYFNTKKNNHETIYEKNCCLFFTGSYDES